MVVLGGGAVSYERGTPVGGGHHVAASVSRCTYVRVEVRVGAALRASVGKMFTNEKEVRRSGRLCIRPSGTWCRVSVRRVERASAVERIGTNRPVKARFWPCLDSFSVRKYFNKLNLLPPRSAADSKLRARTGGPMLLGLSLPQDRRAV